MERTEQDIREALAGLIDGDTDTEEFAEEFGQTPTRSFEEQGVLSSDEGLVFKLPSGQRVFLTVQVQ